jgi:hypothetical protein
MAAAKTIKLANKRPNHAGARYEGEVSIATGQREGQGKYWYPNQYFEYDGEWDEGRKHGHGRLQLGADSYYEGQFCRGQIEGQGCRYWADGSTYNGSFRNGERQGRGVYEKPGNKILEKAALRYSGNWAENKYHGHGELQMPHPLGQGLIMNYVGEFQKHRFEGQGTLSEPGRRYEGSFQRGLFHGHGILRQGDGSDDKTLFIYTGSFEEGLMHGQGVGHDGPSGIKYDGLWQKGQSLPVPTKWDISVPDGDGESYVPFSERLREEAAEQVKDDADPKAKGKKKAAPKGKDAAAEPEESPGPELVLRPGEILQKLALRLRAEDGELVTAESGRCFSVTMYKERLGPAGDDGVPEILRRPVNFGDRRPTYHDPMDGDPPPDPKAKAKAKAGAPPEEEEEEPPYPGDEAREGVFEGEFMALGESDEWFLPVHLQEAIYWLRVEDTTTLEPNSCFPIIPPLEFPIRVSKS